VRHDHPLAGRSIRRAELAPFPRLDVAPLVNRHLGYVEAPATVSDPHWSHPVRAPLSTNSVKAGWDILRSSDAYLIYPVSVTPEFADAGVIPLDVTDRPEESVDIGIYTLRDMTQDEVVSSFLEALEREHQNKTDLFRQ
jgi:DNA-binding transcriptional LysR family regulator